MNGDFEYRNDRREFERQEMRCTVEDMDRYLLQLKARRKWAMMVAYRTIKKAAA